MYHYNSLDFYGSYTAEKLHNFGDDEHIAYRQKWPLLYVLAIK